MKRGVMTEKMTVMDRYEELKNKIITRKNEFKNLMEFVEKHTAYLTAPASIKYHMNKESGLLEHSVNVAENMLRIKEVLAPEITVNLNT